MQHLVSIQAHAPFSPNSGTDPHVSLFHNPAGLYKAKDWSDAIDKARRLVEFGGHGHTSCLYTGIGNKQHVNDFQDAMETVRILINSPASQG